MASVQSLGLLEPTGLSHLVAEGILPPDPLPSSYRCTRYQCLGSRPGQLVEEEILVAGTSVVWSQCGAIKIVINLDEDDESIVTAFTTSFTVVHEGGLTQSRSSDEKALVVILRNQAQILQVSGDIQVVPLSFEVQAAFPCPHGFVLQRKLAEDEKEPEEESMISHHDLSTINESQSTIKIDSNRPSLALPNATSQVARTKHKGIRVPRTYSCTQLLDELGLVVHGRSSKVESLEDCHALPADEDILYMSPRNELAFDNLLNIRQQATLCIAVTRDVRSGSLSIWHVAQDVPFSTERSSHPPKARKSGSTRRKSSNIYSRRDGASTPVPPRPRESFGGLARSYADNLSESSAVESKKSTTEDLVSQLGPEFEQAGVQTRSSRRVSSMLARTDLGAGHDRGVNHDLTTGRMTRKSLNRGGRRVESTGSFGDRQSFGARRSSIYATTSMMSNGTSFLGVPGQLRHDDLDSLHPLDTNDDSTLFETGHELRHDLGFFKVTTFALSEESPIGDSDFKVSIFPSPGLLPGGKQELLVCILGRDSKCVAIVTLQVTTSTHEVASLAINRTRQRVKATSIKRGSGIDSSDVLSDGAVQRLILLTKTRQGRPSLQLEAPWSVPFSVDLPLDYKASRAIHASHRGKPRDSEEQVNHRTIPAFDIDITGVEGYGTEGRLLLEDVALRKHVVEICLQPKDTLVQNILSIASYVFGTDATDTALVCFWEITRWLRTRPNVDTSEWTSIVVFIFVLAVPFIDAKVSKTGTPQKWKKGGLLRSSSGTAIDLASYDAMMGAHSASSAGGSYNLDSWSWLSRVGIETMPDPSSAHKRPASLHDQAESTSMMSATFIQECVVLAREFVQSPAGESATGTDGYLPIAIAKDQNLRQTTLAKMLVALHLFREECKLDILTNANPTHQFKSLAAVLAQLGTWLGWADWNMQPGSYYWMDSSDSPSWVFEEANIRNLSVPSQPFQPPSVLAHIAACLGEGPDQSFTTLQDLREKTSASKGPGFPAEVLRLTPRTCAMLQVMSTLSHDKSSALVDDVSSSVDDSSISHLPEIVFNIIQEVLKLDARRSQQAEHQRKSIAKKLQAPRSHDKHSRWSALNLHPTHVSAKDYHSISNSSLETETLQRWDASSEIERHAITRLLFQEDRRFQEASRLVNQTRPPVVECTPEPHWSESDLLEAQKELAQFVTRRTLSVASGRGMMHFSARTPLLTERVPIPAFSLQCLMKPRNTSESSQAMTFSADKAAFTEDKVCWAFFHNGASAGLMISRDAKGIDTSWILYNKPPELTNRHAGFLLSLGLNGHLKSLAKWVAFKYLTPKHTMTSIGLLLGLSASYLGTQDQLITRLLSVHVTRLLPPGAAELNLSPLTQTTGIVGIGLLYHNSGHRRMSEVMLSEIENNDSEEGASDDTILRDEGYRLAAGFSLGLINLGQGKTLHSLHDLAVTERLLSIAIGTKNVNLVHVLDRATAGAVMAIALIFLKTNDSSVANKIDIPDTLHQFDYVRPDIFLLRTLARHLIMWDSIKPTPDFINSSLPPAYREGHGNKLLVLATEEMPLFNIVAGICFAIGLRFAGTQREDVRDLLVGHLDLFLQLTRLPCHNYDARVALNSVRNCLDVMALATACVMAGSGDLIVMRRLRSLHGRTDRDTPFGSHMAAHMALGTLFLAGGTMTLGTHNLAVAALCIAFYPLFPNDVLDNKTHLQALRHLWTLAVEGRCLIARTSQSAGSVIGGVEAHVHLKSGTISKVQTPGLLPDFDAINKIDVRGDGYYPLTLDFSDSDLRAKIDKEQAVNVVLSRRPMYDKPTGGDALIERMEELEEARQSSGGAVPSINANVANRHASATGDSNEINPFEWVFDLSTFNDYDYAEKDLVLSSMGYLIGAGKEVLEGTVVDTRLELESGVLPEAKGEKVKTSGLWELRLLFEMVERFGYADEEDGNDEHEGTERRKSAMGLRREVVENLRERVWRFGRELNREEAS